MFNVLSKTNCKYFNIDFAVLNRFAKSLHLVLLKSILIFNIFLNFICIHLVLVEKECRISYGK